METSNTRIKGVQLAYHLSGWCTVDCDEVEERGRTTFFCRKAFEASLSSTTPAPASRHHYP